MNGVGSADVARVAGLARWEWFKLRRRWMPWILLVLFVLVCQVGVWASFFEYQSLNRSGGQVPFAMDAGGMPRMVSCKDVLEGDASKLPEEITPELAEGLRAQCLRNREELQQETQDMYDGFTTPGSIRAALGGGMSFGLVLLAVLTASVFGAEYGLGTLRLILARGTGRWRYLTGKFVLLAAALAGALFAAIVVTLISSAIASALADSPPAGIAGVSGWDDAGIAVGKTWTGMLPFLALVGMVATVVRSTAAGMAIGLGYYFAEQILVAIFSNLFDWFDSVSDYLLVQNISTWAGNSAFGIEGESGTSVRTLLLLIAYGAAFLAGAYWIFHRRDVAGASGG